MCASVCIFVLTCAQVFLRSIRIGALVQPPQPVPDHRVETQNVLWRIGILRIGGRETGDRERGVTQRDNPGRLPLNPSLSQVCLHLRQLLRWGPFSRGAPRWRPLALEEANSRLFDLEAVLRWEYRWGLLQEVLGSALGRMWSGEQGGGGGREGGGGGGRESSIAHVSVCAIAQI